ncbi:MULTISPECIES: DUF4249 domain-containing protein [unclassified Spirosoma]|uniref:DUF4249 domain-containing protein n=1 Tax=unclassified Spirosoma TaxID=2621999 RepID=UPI000965B23A|nr:MULTISPECIES: DUF4249 domain-containing protein [unclassified Spirosoma]MBN8823656.1 DUF4249 domain-containing protein [Spirosoma sp.]OJW76789.1 MAG: hypothetical protein BGO59_21390 [Spirosoma sp. 48-14]
MYLRLFLIGLTFLVVACVDPEDLLLHGTNDIIVVDGTITDRAEAQIIKLNRSQADPLTGRFGTLPITRATVQIMVDSSVLITCHETIDGSYQLPSDFKGQTGHAYQLRFTLTDGTSYQSSQQVMPAVVPIQKAYAEFNPKSLPANQFDGFTAGHDLSIDVQDPVDQHNYYRWDWILYERQYWCKTCQQGVYAVYKVLPHTYLYEYYFVAGNELFEDCFSPPTYTTDFGAPYVPKGYWYYDYNCRTACWEILRNVAINVFDDQYSNGGLLVKRKVASIPFYQHAPCLVDVRQLSLTKDAYRYFQLLQQQTQNTGGLADSPPTALAGNVRNTANSRESVAGYFTTSAVSLYHQWLDRKDAEGIPLGAMDPEGPHDNIGEDLFYALNSRRPNPEPSPPYQGNRFPPNVRIWPNNDRPPTAPCTPSETKTPYKPEGWRD